MRGLERTIVVGLLCLMAGCVGGIWLAARSDWIDWNSVVTAAPPPAAVPTPPPAAAGKSQVGSPNPGLTEAVGIPPRAYNSGGGVISRRAARIDLLPTPGCLWELDPVMLEPDGSWTRTRDKQCLMVTTAVPSDRSGTRIIVTRIGPGRTILPPTNGPGPGFGPGPGPGPGSMRGTIAMFPEIRVVVFDEDGHRTNLRPTRMSGGTGPDQVLEQVDWRGPGGESAATQPFYFGIERVASDADQAATVAARARARALQVAILPTPRLGEPYRFSLVSAAGQPVRSEDLLGKAVVVAIGRDHDLTALMSSLVRSDHASDVAMVFVSFDATAEVFEKRLRAAKLDAPHVVIPNDPAIRSLWTTGGAISAIPMFLVLDRDGVLRHIDDHWFALEDRISDTLGKPRSFPPFRPHITDKFGPPRLPDAIPFLRAAEPQPGHGWLPVEEASPDDWVTLNTPVPFLGPVMVPWHQPFRWTRPSRSRGIYPPPVFLSRVASNALNPGAALNGKGLPRDPMAILAPRVKFLNGSAGGGPSRFMNAPASKTSDR